MSVRYAIRQRRSIRKYKSAIPKDRHIKIIVEAARWAPSGLNNQPWRFMVLKGQEKDGLAEFTKDEKIIKNAPVGICVFLDKRRSYSREKDIMAIGACIQNMLLAAYELGLGSCWLGEILNRRKDAERYLRTPKNLELISVITIGFPAEHPKSTRSVFQAQVLVLKRRS